MTPQFTANMDFLVNAVAPGLRQGAERLKNQVRRMAGGRSFAKSQAGGKPLAGPVP